MQSRRASLAVSVPAQIYDWKATPETRAQSPAGAGAVIANSFCARLPMVWQF